MLERNPKNIKCGALLGVSVDHAELPLKQDYLCHNYLVSAVPGSQHGYRQEFANPQNWVEGKVYTLIHFLFLTPDSAIHLLWFLL